MGSRRLSLRLLWAGLLLATARAFVPRSSAARGQRARAAFDDDSLDFDEESLDTVPASLCRPCARVEIDADAQCPCGGGREHQYCCGRYLDRRLHPQMAIELLQARYTAHCTKDVDYIVQTTHRTHADWLDVNLEDPETFNEWKGKLRDNLAVTKFAGLRVWDTQIVSPKCEKILWSARLRVFDGIVSEDRVLVQEFVERSVFVFEEDRWWYQGGDPDWEPKSITTGGPLNNLGGGGGGGGGDRSKARSDADKASAWRKSLAPA